jgi:DNA-binding beta-propeller fold protein YncE
MRTAIWRWVVGAAVGVGLPAAAAAQAGGNGTIYLGTYSKQVFIIDEATMTVTDSIPVSVGIPLGLTLSANRRHLYTLDPSFQRVEVLDVASRKSLRTFTLSTEESRVRLWGFNVEPQERFAVMLVKTYTKKDDRFVIGPPTLLKYDLTRGAVTDTIPWPQGQERDFAQILFSPNGNLLYFFTADDILIYDSATLKQVDRWELGRSIDDGMGRFNFGFPESFYEEPGFFTGLFRSTDPVNARTLMGVARVDLVNKQVDYYSLGPSEFVGFTLAPGRRRAYGLRQQVGNYQFWSFDLQNRRVSQRVEFEGRPRMGLSVSTNGSQLYVHTAGNTVDVYDANTLRLVRTATFSADMTRLLVVPR